VLAALGLLVVAAVGIMLLPGPSTPPTAPPVAASPGTVTPLAGTTTPGAAKALATQTVNPGKAAVINTPAISVNVPAGAY
jgi:hypothetical protein